MNTAFFPSLTWFTRSGGKRSPKTPRIGLCLSAGAARGLAHVGVIQVLEEQHIPIAAIAGSSMGAYVGSLWAAGLNGTELELLAREIKDRRTLIKLLDPVFPPSAGLIKGDKIRQHLARSLGTINFEGLKIPFFAVATDLDRLAPVILDHGNVASAVHASAAIPGICAPVFLNGRRFTDGAASEPLPVSLLRQHDHLDHVIAVSIAPHVGESSIKRNCNPFRWLNLLAYGNVLNTYSRALSAAQMQLAAKEAALADVVIRPLITESRWCDFENFDRYIQAGRAAAIAALPKIRALIEPQTLIKPHRHETHRPHADMGLLVA